MGGMRIDAIAEASAVDDPETPDITMLPTTEACASPARKCPTKRAREIDKLLADAARGHDRAGENEIGHRQKREGIELAEHLLREERHDDFGQHRHADEADQRNGNEDRDAQQHHAEQGREQKRDHGVVTSGGSSSGSGAGSSPASRRMTTNRRYTLPRIIP